MIPLVITKGFADRPDKFFRKNHSIEHFDRRSRSRSSDDSSYKSSKPDYNDNYQKGETRNKVAAALKKADQSVNNNDETEGQDIEEAKDTAAIKDSAAQSGLEVAWLGLVIDSTDHRHFYSELEKYLDYLERHDLVAGEIYAIGKSFYTKELEELQLKITQRAGTMHFYNEIPEKFNLELSPTYLIGTEQGIYMLEAIGNLNSYFTGSGRFVFR